MEQPAGSGREMMSSAEEFVRLRFSSDPAEYERAAHASAPVEVWRDVVERYPDARFWVAQNKTVPIEILETLAGDDDARVRVMVAHKRKAPAWLLERLAGDGNEMVRMAVARHRNTPPDVLRSLRADPWEAIRNTIDERLGPV
jgi:Leucine rich repeat variant